MAFSLELSVDTRDTAYDIFTRHEIKVTLETVL